MKNLEVMMCFLMFFIIIISTVYYPIIAIEYFSTIETNSIENVDQVKKCLCCKSNEKNIRNESIRKFVNNLDNINNRIVSENKNIQNVTIDNEEDEYSPSCCPSIVTTSTGCLCDNTKLISMIESRGNNKEMCI